MAGKAGSGPRPKRAAVRPAGLAPQAETAIAPGEAPGHVPVTPALRIYLVNPLLVGPLPAWDANFAHIAGLGFTVALLAPPSQPGGDGNLYHIGDPDLAHPCLESAGRLVPALAHLVELARGHGLALHLDLVLDRVAAEGVFAARHPAWFGPGVAEGPPDPRQPASHPGTVVARWNDPALRADWLARLQGWVAAGIAGFRCLRIFGWN